MESEFRRVVDALPGLVWTAHPDGQVDFLNRRWCDYTGLTAAESSGQGWQATIHTEDLPELLRRWHAILITGEQGEMDVRLRRVDGAYRWFLIRASPLPDAAGHIAKWCGVNTDIDARLLSRISSLGALTTSIAHEMNQPLSGIITNASTCLRMLAADPPNVDGALETTRRTIRDGHRASEVITRLRALFTQHDIAAEPMELNEAARELIALLKTR